MSYIGAQPTTAAFPFDQFSGNGTTTAFTMSYAPASTTSMVVSISGVVQNPNTYSIVGLTLTFSAAPPTGTNNIGVLYLGIPATSVSTPGNTAYLSSTEFTATAGQTTFSPSGTYQVGFINVIRNGSQLAPSDYTATNGTTVVLGTACVAGDVVVIQVYNLVSVSNALPLTGGTVTGNTTFNSGVNLAVSSGDVGIGTSSPTGKLDVLGVAGALTNGIIRSSDGSMSRLTLSNTNRNWTISNYGTQFAPNGTFNIADETAAAVVFRIDTSANTYINSGYGSLAIAYGCRAWVNFNGTGTVAIRASGNVSSITDIGVGLYGINFTNAMPDGNYAIAGITNNNGTNRMLVSPHTTQSTTVCQIDVGVGGSVFDSTKVYVAIFR